MIKKISPDPSLPKSGEKPQPRTPNSALRRHAEKKLKERSAENQEQSFKDAQSVIHELQVHQIELEMQNEELRRAQIELEESHKKYSDLYDFAPAGYFTINKKGLILEVNLAGAAQLGTERGILKNKRFSGFITEADQDIYYLHQRKVFEINAPQSCAVRLKKKDGPEFFALLYSSTVKDSEGNVTLCLTTVVDISELREIEQKLAASENKLMKHAHALGERVKELNCLYGISTLAGKQDIPLNEILQGVADLIPPAWQYPEVTASRVVLGEQEFRTVNYKETELRLSSDIYVHGNRAGIIEVYYFEERPESDEGPFMKEERILLEAIAGKVGRFAERMSIELTLRASEERYRSYIELTGELGWTTNADGEVVEDMPTWRKYTGQTYEEIKGWGWSKVLHPEDLEHTVTTWNKAVKEKSAYDVEYRIRRHDGIYRYFLARGIPAFNKDGSIREWVGTCIDITERKNAEETVRNALNETNQRQKEISALFSASRAVIEQHEFKDTARSIFNSCKDLIGATAGYVALLSKDGAENEVLFLDSGGLPCSVDPTLPMPIRGLRETAYRTKKVAYENDFDRSGWMKFMPEGHTKLENVLFAPLVIKGEAVGLLGLGNKPGGFTENDALISAAFGELAAIALHNSMLFELLTSNEEKFRSVAQTASDAIISTDSHGQIIFWNSGAETIFGYGADEITGKSFTFIVPERLREDHQKGMDRVITGGMQKIIGKRIETTGLRKGGSEFPLELSLAKWETVEGIYFTAIIRDITLRKQVEKEREQLLEELGRSNIELQQFANIASHDLQEPLRMISSYVELIAKRYRNNLDSDADEFIDFIVQGTSHMHKLLNDLLTYARVGTRRGPLELTDLNSVLDKTAVNLKKLVDENHAGIIYEYLPSVYADEMQMLQIFQNLIGNAIKFRGSEKPRIQITAEQKETEWVLRVSDNGIGISPKFYDKIFLIFKRLHSREKYPGTGIGLAICKKIVEQHGGRIWVESEPGKGSAFYFSIPMKEADNYGNNSHAD